MSWDANGSPTMDEMTPEQHTAFANSIVEEWLTDGAAEAAERQGVTNMATQTDDEIRAAVDARRKANAKEAAEIAARDKIPADWYDNVGPAVNAQQGFVRCFDGYDFSGQRHVDPAFARARAEFLRGIGITPSAKDFDVANLGTIDERLPEQLDGVDYRLIGYSVMVGNLPLDVWAVVKGASGAFGIGPMLAEVAAVRTIEEAFTRYKAEKAAHAGTPHAGASGGDAGGGPVIDSQDGHK